MLDIEPGGVFSQNGQVLKFSRGQLTKVTAADTVVTGLATVVAVVASLESDPTDNPFMASAQIGDQAGTPAAGSIIVKTWQNSPGTDPTPAVATTFGKRVNWVAIGKQLSSEVVRETFWRDDDVRHPHDRRHESPRETTLFLSRKPVSKLTSVTVDDVTIDPSEVIR